MRATYTNTDQQESKGIIIVKQPTRAARVGNKLQRVIKPGLIALKLSAAYEEGSWWCTTEQSYFHNCPNQAKVVMKIERERGMFFKNWSFCWSRQCPNSLTPKVILHTTRRNQNAKIERHRYCVCLVQYIVY